MVKKKTYLLTSTDAGSGDALRAWYEQFVADLAAADSIQVEVDAGADARAPGRPTKPGKTNDAAQGEFTVHLKVGPCGGRYTELRERFDRSGPIEQAIEKVVKDTLRKETPGE